MRWCAAPASTVPAGRSRCRRAPWPSWCSPRAAEAARSFPGGSPTRETVTCDDYSPPLGAPPQPAHRPDLGRCSQAAEDQGGDQPKMSPTVTQSGPGRLIQGGMRGFSTHLGGRRGRRRRRACHTIFSISQNDTQRYKLATNTARLADTHILRTTITIDSTQ